MSPLSFGKRFEWSLAITPYILMAAPIVETIPSIWSMALKAIVVMAAPNAVTAPSSVQNLMNSQDDSMVSRGVLMIET